MLLLLLLLFREPASFDPKKEVGGEEFVERRSFKLAEALTYSLLSSQSKARSTRQLSSAKGRFVPLDRVYLSLADGHAVPPGLLPLPESPSL